MTVRVKICGVNDAAGFDAAVVGRADWLGFVFFSRSPRHVTPDQAGALHRRHDGGPARVGLFVDPADDEVAAALDAVPLDALQLYASPARATEVAARFPVAVWRAVGVSGTGDLPGSPDAAAFVIEAKPPPGSDRPGGNAAALDWAMLRGWNAPAPWLLAGGLTPGNVAEAIRASGARAVDVSSGVEHDPGHKDPALVAAFILAARSVQPV